MSSIEDSHNHILTDAKCTSLRLGSAEPRRFQYEYRTLLCSTTPGSVVLVERSSKAHPHETNAVFLEPLVADLLGGHEHMSDTGLQKRKKETKTAKRGKLKLRK